MIKEGKWKKRVGADSCKRRGRGRCGQFRTGRDAGLRPYNAQTSGRAFRRHQELQRTPQHLGLFGEDETTTKEKIGGEGSVFFFSLDEGEALTVGGHEDLDGKHRGKEDNGVVGLKDLDQGIKAVLVLCDQRAVLD